MVQSAELGKRAPGALTRLDGRLGGRPVPAFIEFRRSTTPFVSQPERYMLKPRFAMLLITFVLAFVAGDKRADAQAPSDSVVISTNAKVRVTSRFLGAGWHEGTLIRISVSSGGDCLGFAPTARADFRATTIDGLDSLEVWAPAALPASATSVREPVPAPGTWIGLTRTRRQSLSKGCGPPRS